MVLVPTVLVGIATISFFPTCLSYGAELTFPLQPALVNAFMNFLGQMCTFVITIAASMITDVDGAETEEISHETRLVRQANTMSVVYLFGICCFLTFILSFFVKEDLRRVNYNQQSSFKQMNESVELEEMEH